MAMSMNVLNPSLSWTLGLMALPGEELPTGLEECWREAGFACERMVLSEFVERLDESGEVSTLVLVWVGESWGEGVRVLAADLPEKVRGVTALIGSAMPDDMLGKVYQAGGLVAVEWPLAEWVLPALIGTLERSRKGFEAALATSLAALRQDLEQVPEEVLVRTAQLAGEVLGCDLAFSAIEQPGSRKLLVLVRNRERIIATELDEVDRRLVQVEGSLTSMTQAEPVVVAPFLNMSGGNGFPWRSVLSVPLRVERHNVAGSTRSLRVFLRFYWCEAFLPSATERLVLEGVSAIATSGLIRLVEQAYGRNQRLLARNQKLALDNLGRSRSLKSNEIFSETQVRSLLSTFSQSFNLRRLWARISTSTRRTAKWISGDPQGPKQPPMEVPEKLRRFNLLKIPEDAGWAVVVPIHRRTPAIGQVVAVFPSRESAEEGVDEVALLADDLLRLVREVRKSRDVQALTRFSTAPASLAEAKSGLRKMAEVVKDCLEADGAKIYVLRRSPEGSMIWQLCNTEVQNAESKEVPFDPKRGLADWVLREKAWLLIPEVREADRAMEVPQRGIAGGRGKVEVFARPGREQMPNAEHPDPETSILVVPFEEQMVAGAISVWRERSVPSFNTDLDVDSLKGFAPHVAAACQRLLQLEKAEEQLQETSRLARVLAESTILQAGYKAVSEGSGKLANAACTVLFQRDGEGKGPILLYPSAGWHAKGSSFGLPPAILFGPDDRKWESVVAAELGKSLAPLIFRSFLTPTEREEEGRRSIPPLTVALFDFPRKAGEPDFASDELLEHFARSYLQSAAALLKIQVPNFASRLVDRIGGPPMKGTSKARSDSRTPEGILAEATLLLQKATGADAALFYLGTPLRMTARGSWPESKALLGLQVQPGSRTEKSLSMGISIRVPETDLESEPLNWEALSTIIQTFGWQKVRSWLCCPVIHEQRVIGLIKLLTRGQGRFLGEDHMDVVRRVAQQTAWEMHKANRRVILEELLALSNKVSGRRGTKLGAVMVSELSDWARRRFMRPECEVAIVARIEQGATLVRATLPSLGETKLGYLETLSLRFEGKSIAWGAEDPPGDSWRDLANSIAPAGLGKHIEIPSAGRVIGHLFLVDREDFSEEERESVREAARSIAVLLNAERERNELKQTLGRFRHAALGPIQGVNSTAQTLALLAEKAGANPALVKTHKARLAKEAEILRLWRENQRFYQNERVEVRPRKQPLKPLVERCFERFRAIFEERSIKYELDWLIGGELHLVFDEHAIDLVLSNLLDNARKYAFHNQRVEVGAVSTGEMVHVWVEDVGHNIDEEQLSKILRFGERGERFDPFRIIPGEGLGLPMARAIVRAHGGRLRWTSRELGPGRTPETTPYRVRFTMELPLVWKRTT